MRTNAASIAMQVSALAVDPLTGLPVVVLKDRAGDSSVAICIGLSEASAIAAELDGIELERPMTHQLMFNALEALGVSVCCIEVCDLAENTFYAALHLETDSGDRVVQDARPSDALALALRSGAEIRVALAVIEKATRIGLREPADADEELCAGIESGLDPDDADLDCDAPAFATVGARDRSAGAITPPHQDDGGGPEPIFEPGAAGAGGGAAAGADARHRRCDRPSARTLAILAPPPARGRDGAQADEVTGAEFLDALGDEVFGKWKM